MFQDAGNLSIFFMLKFSISIKPKHYINDYWLHQCYEAQCLQHFDNFQRWSALKKSQYFLSVNIISRASYILGGPDFLYQNETLNISIDVLLYRIRLYYLDIMVDRSVWDWLCLRTAALSLWASSQFLKIFLQLQNVQTSG